MIPQSCGNGLYFRGSSANIELVKNLIKNLNKTPNAQVPTDKPSVVGGDYAYLRLLDVTESTKGRPNSKTSVMMSWKRSVGRPVITKGRVASILQRMVNKCGPTSPNGTLSASEFINGRSDATIGVGGAKNWIG